MFLLCKNDVTGEDKTFTINYPFMLTLPNRLYTFAAFATEKLAEYFKKVLGLEDDYKVVNIGVVEKRKLKESQHFYVFSTKGDVNRLLGNREKSRCRMRNVIEIAKIRPDCT